MGNCFGSQLACDSNPSSTNPSKFSTPGTSHTYSSNGGGLSATDSSAGRSRFSAALSEDSCLNGEILPTANLKIYSFADLKTATKSFKSDMVLGMGGFGMVYKGWVDERTLMPSKLGSGKMVAIKKLNPESTQGFEEWQACSGEDLLKNDRISDLPDDVLVCILTVNPERSWKYQRAIQEMGGTFGPMFLLLN